MKKNKLLKVLGCAALIAAPVIAAPIVLTTGCSTTDPTPKIKVNSIDKIVLTQNNVEWTDDGSSYNAPYVSNEVANEQTMPDIKFNDILIQFEINGKDQKYTYPEIADQVSFEFIGARSIGDTGYKTEIFTFENGKFSTSNEAWETAIKSTTLDASMIMFEPTIAPKGKFKLDYSFCLNISYGLKNSSSRDDLFITFLSN